MLTNIFQSTTIPVLEEVVNFAQVRHTVLAGNIANKDTPGYQFRDVSVEDFQQRLKAAIRQRNDPRPMSPGEPGYHGGDPKGDAEGHGAQDILPRPFTADDLIGRVDELLTRAAAILTTQAVPQETLEALRKESADGDSPSFSSDDLFADILSDVEKEEAKPAAPSSPAGAQKTSGDSVDEAQFRRYFELMGVQRHLKAAGIFARLWHRDGKRGYLADIPRTLGYIVAVGARQPAIGHLARFLETRVLPGLTGAQATHGG